jgi:hypothetical protein
MRSQREREREQDRKDIDDNNSLDHLSMSMIPREEEEIHGPSLTLMLKLSERLQRQNKIKRQKLVSSHSSDKPEGRLHV